MENEEKKANKELKPRSKYEKLVEEAHNKNIVSVAESLGMKLKTVGRGYLHWDEHDSFIINTDKNLFYWNSRRSSGDSIELVKTMKDCDFKGAVEYLSGTKIEDYSKNSAAPKKEFHYYWKDHNTTNLARKYLHEERKLSNETIDFFLSQGLISQTSYKSAGLDKTEPVVVFKAFDRDGKMRGMTAQGIWKMKEYEKYGHLKKTNGDGFYGMAVRVGNPPAGAEINEERPLKIIAFEAPIDLMSYYEIFKDRIGDAVLISGNGVPKIKGTISKFIANELGAKTSEEEKSKFLDYLEKNIEPNKMFEIILAVDNDEIKYNPTLERNVQPAQDLIANFGITKFPVSSHVPKLLEGQKKNDWNDMLKHLKKTKEMDFQNHFDKSVSQSPPENHDDLEEENELDL